MQDYSFIFQSAMGYWLQRSNWSQSREETLHSKTQINIVFKLDFNTKGDKEIHKSCFSLIALSICLCTRCCCAFTIWNFKSQACLQHNSQIKKLGFLPFLRNLLSADCSCFWCNLISLLSVKCIFILIQHIVVKIDKLTLTDVIS